MNAREVNVSSGRAIWWLLAR